MKFKFSWPSGFWENIVLIYSQDSNMSDLAWNVKVQPWPVELIYTCSHCLIWFNISKVNNDLVILVMWPEQFVQIMTYGKESSYEI